MHTRMDTKVRASLLAVLLIAVLVLSAGPVASDTKDGLAGTGAYRVVAAARQLKLEDDIAAELPVDVGVQRRILSTLTNSVFEPNRPACIRTCAAAGRPYTGRGCKSAYRCVQG